MPMKKNIMIEKIRAAYNGSLRLFGDRRVLEKTPLEEKLFCCVDAVLSNAADAFPQMLREHLFLGALNRDRRVQLIDGVGNKGLEQRLTVLRKLDHTGEHVDVLVRLTGRTPTLAIDFHDEQTRMNLSENAFAFDNREN